MNCETTKPGVTKSVKRGWKAERIAKIILTKEGFKNIYRWSDYRIDKAFFDKFAGFDGYLYRKERFKNMYKWHGYLMGNAFFNKFDCDYLCRKDGVVYMIDVKSKLYKYREDRTKNYFYVTKKMINAFEHFKNKKNTRVNILAIIEKGGKILYKFYDWSEFSIPPGFFQGKYKNTVRITLKNNLDLSKFKKLKKVYSVT